MKKYHLGILKNENPEEHLEWVAACEKSPQVTFDIIEFTSSGWLDAVKAKKYDCLLARPSGAVGFFKNLYDERIITLNSLPEYKIYPSANELLIYENKRMLAYFLGAREIPHPATHIFYDKEEALRFASATSYPVVGKTSIGAGGSGVQILKDREALTGYINLAFSGKGITRSWGPNIRKGNYSSRILYRLSNPAKTLRYFLKKKQNATIDPQKWHVILQQYLEVDFEWRCVKIGDSYFAHKKLRRFGEKISGSSNVSWDGPSEKLLNFMKAVSDKGNLLCQAMDIFEDSAGNFYINELQCFWGSKNPHQMILEGTAGRYLYSNGTFTFEPGTFNQNNSYDLRLQHVIGLLEESKL